MYNSPLHHTLYTEHPKELVDGLLNCFSNAVSEFRQENWKYFGSEIAQFIEFARRIIDSRILHEIATINSPLPKFNENWLKKLEQSDKTHDESYRIIIPRVLFSMNTIRNKRGTVHVNSISPNKIDSSLQLSNMKWVLAELIRLASDTSSEQAEELIDSIIEKESVLLWEIDNKTRVLDSNLSYRDKILLLLYKHNTLQLDKLFKFTEYKNKSRFRKMVESMHNQRLLELSEDDFCTISPSGIQCVEKLYWASQRKE